MKEQEIGKTCNTHGVDEKRIKILAIDI